MISEKIVDIIADQLCVQPEKVVPAASFEDLGADSLDIVELIMAFEEAYDIEIDEKTAEKITTVQDIVDEIGSHHA